MGEFGLFLATVVASTAGASRGECQEETLYFRNFVRHSSGGFCQHRPPDASFVVFVNSDETRILTDQAPRLDAGGDPNIDGKGTFGVELGHFTSPPVQEGDTICIRFICRATGQQGILRDSVTSIPWHRFPLTLVLAIADMPARPTNVELSFEAQGNRILQWKAEGRTTYSVYRRTVDDSLQQRGSPHVYVRLAEKLLASSFTDSTGGTERHGYILVPWKGNVPGAHSAEVIDFPLPPANPRAVVAYTDPFRVAVYWEASAQQQNLRYGIYRASTPPVAVTPDNLLAETEDLCWVDGSVQEHETYFYRVVAVNQAGIESLPSEEVTVTVIRPEVDLPDLDVLFISRSPRYPRYDVVYDPPGYNPRLRPETENHRHYPREGEMMHYVATLRNSGGRTAESLVLHWYVDSVLVQTETIQRLFPGQRLRYEFLWPWASQPYYVRCEVYPEGAASEVTARNNSLQIRSNALAFHFHVEQNIVDLFESQQNPLGSFSFEDWAQVHINKLNEFFADAHYADITPDGVFEAVFLDTVSYYANGELSAGGTHAPQGLLWDGQWGFTGDANALNYFRNEVLLRNGGMDWALLHELGHQLGLIDLYRMDVAERQLRVIEPRTGEKPPLQPLAWDVLYYCSRKDFLMHTNFQAGFSDHSAGALRRNAGKRRGYYGEYLADIPRENELLLKRPDGSVVRNSEVWVYQKQDDVIPNTPKFRGRTDSAGVFAFPHWTDSLYAGGIWVKNPFSTVYSQDPNVVGTNATLFVRVATPDSVGYFFLDICPFNVAYWSGKKHSAVYPITVKRWFYLPASGVEAKAQDMPSTWRLHQNIPNPFNHQTALEYEIPERSHVRLWITSVLGRKVCTLVDDVRRPGRYRVTWNSKDDRGQDVAGGLYLCVLQAGQNVEIRKMLLLR